MTTTKLYYDSSYTTEWQTSVIEAVEKPEGCFVRLAATAFYPEGGGQPYDTGEIGGIAVLEVLKDGEEVLHKVERLPETKEVHCRIDWERRFDHMQQHSGQHLLSAVCLERFGAKTLSFHLGADYATIDVELAELGAERLQELEQEVNRHIYANHPITAYFVTPEELASLPLVKPPTVQEHIRIVEIKDVEYNACGGTHVAATGELGLIKLLKAEKTKGNVRLYFVSGGRALQEFSRSQQLLGSLAVRFNASPETIGSRIDKLETERKQALAELEELKAKYDTYVMRELAGKRSGNLIVHEVADRPFKDVQPLASKLAEESGALVLLGVPGENKVVLAAPPGWGLSCGTFFKEQLAAFGGKGGGGDRMAQAAFAGPEAARKFLVHARGLLESPEADEG